MKIVNVATVKHLSPFRYPGGKTWFVPYMRYLMQFIKANTLVEPFAGGAIVGLTAAYERWVSQVILSEIDECVASVWEVILSDEYKWLCKQIDEFQVNIETVHKALSIPPTNKKLLAFQTLLHNRVSYGGILAPGASFIRKGENGKGLASRWYPKTLIERIKTVHSLKNIVTFKQIDGFEIIREFLKKKSVVFFVDPPYIGDEKRAGCRLYKYNDVNHEELFWFLSQSKGYVVITYADSKSVTDLAKKYGFELEKVPMRNTHNRIQYELVITNFYYTRPLRPQFS